MIRRPPRSTLFPTRRSSDLSLEVPRRSEPRKDFGRQSEVLGTHAPTPRKQCNELGGTDRKSTRLNSSHLVMSYAAFCLKKKRRGSPRAYRSASSKEMLTIFR